MLKISIIGYGKLAHHLVQRCKSCKEIRIHQILVRYKPATDDTSLEFIDDITLLDDNTDLIILTVQDKNIEDVSQNIPFVHVPIVHTSGVKSSLLLERFDHYGVWYPVQTFGVGSTINWEKVPICILNSDEIIGDILQKFTALLGCKAYAITEDQRQYLHLAAVFSNNFTNHLLTYVEKILSSRSIDKALITPLLRQTIDNFEVISPELAQTGPAVRNDVSTMESHIELLYSLHLDDAISVYRTLSQSIALSQSKT